MRQDDPLDVLRYIVTTIGQRPATSLDEAQAAAYVDGRLRRAGLHVNADTFHAPSGQGVRMLLASLLGLLATLMTGFMPLPAFLLALWLFILVCIHVLTVSTPLFAPRSNSQNIIGTRACEHTPRWRVVLLAPLDTLPHDKSVCVNATWHTLQSIARIIAFGLIAVFSLLMLFNPHPFWWYGQSVPACYLLITLLWPVCIGHGSATGRAGSLAVLLHIAEHLTTLHTVEVWVVALGATTTGNHGLRDFLNRYPFPHAQTLFFVLESIEGGPISYIPYEGIVRQWKADMLLKHVATTVSTAVTSEPIQPHPHSRLSSLASPLQNKNYRVLTLVTNKIEGALSYPPSDNAMHAQTLEQATHLLLGMIRHLDNDAHLQ